MISRFTISRYPLVVIWIARAKRYRCPTRVVAQTAILYRVKSCPSYSVLRNPPNPARCPSGTGTVNTLVTKWITTYVVASLAPDCILVNRRLNARNALHKTTAHSHRIKRRLPARRARTTSPVDRPVRTSWCRTTSNVPRRLVAKTRLM